MADSSSYTLELEALFRKVRKHYTDIKGVAYSYVVRWEWTNGRRYEVRPLYFERLHERKGDVVAARTGTDQAYRYGISELGRVIVEEFYQRGGLAYEAFWQNLDDRTEIMYYKAEQIARIARLDKVDDVPQMYREYEREHGVESRQRETYQYDGNQLTHISLQSNTWTRNATIDYYCLYDGNTLSRIDVSNSLYGPDSRHSIYEQPTLHPTIQSDWLSDETRQKLVDGIIATLAPLKITEPVCALILNYSTSDQFLPSALSLLYQSEQQTRLEDGANSIDVLWLPDYDRDENSYIELKDPDLFALCYDLEAQIVNEDDARNGLAQLARDLIQADWSGKLPISADFIAYTLDIDADSAVERIMLSITPERYDALHKRGLL